ncbi:MAG: hypothetical protein ISS11_08055 [Candidatus Marinimicrobia bacterium]|nr:hypothetical protein [Candidatus Neomarinimicrobiota bacterium]
MGKKKEGVITIVLNEANSEDRETINVINKVAQEVNSSNYGKPLPLEAIAKKLIRDADGKIKTRLVEMQRDSYTNADKINIWIDGYNQKKGADTKIEKDEFIVNVLPGLNKKQLGVLESLAFKNMKSSPFETNILQ